MNQFEEFKKLNPELTYERYKEILVQQIKSSPTNSIQVLSSMENDELLKFLFDFFPPASIIMFEHSLCMTRLQKLVSYIKSKRFPHEPLRIAFDARSSEEQVKYLIDEFQLFQYCEFHVVEQSFKIIPPGQSLTIGLPKATREIHIPESVAMPISTLKSICETISAGRLLFLNQQLQETSLNQFIPHLSPDVHLILGEKLSSKMIKAITKLTKPEVLLSMIAPNCSHECVVRAEGFAQSIKHFQRLVVAEALTPVNIAQTLARHLNEGAILYCLSGGESYIRAIASALKPGAVLMLHPSLSFKYLLTASKYLKPGTGLSIDLELDDVQIEQLSKQLDRGVLYVINTKINSNSELIERLDSKLSTSSGLSLQSIFCCKMVTDIEKIEAFLSDQFQFEGTFYQALPSIVNERNLLKRADEEAITEYQVIRYFIDKYQNATHLRDLELEKIATQFKFNILVNFEDTLATNYSNVALLEMTIDGLREKLIKLLDNLEYNLISNKVNSLSID